MAMRKRRALPWPVATRATRALCLSRCGPRPQSRSVRQAKRPVPCVDRFVCRAAASLAEPRRALCDVAAYDPDRLAQIKAQVILLPGGVMPAELAYGALIEALGDNVHAIAKELEIYAGPEPPPDYTLDDEIDGISRTARSASFDRFHLVGYSGGGASSLAFAAAHPERLLSLALIEPAWFGNDGLSAEEQTIWQEFDRIATLPPDQMMPAFIANQLAPGVEPPPPPPPPPLLAADA